MVEKSIGQGLNFLDAKSEIQVIDYGKDVHLKAKKRSMLDYLKDKLRS